MISVENLSIQVGGFSLQGISFEIPTGQYGVLMGKTGCGKTTVLESLCGLKPQTAGRIRLMDRDVTKLKPAHRGIGYVPQDAALFSTMTVRNHLSLALSIRKWNAKEIRERVDELADLLEITPMLDRKPKGLSGGEIQRVALGRALSFHPQILCLDEPLSALDEAMKESMYRLLRSIREKYGVTTLHVTHSLQEANTLADRIFIMQDGQVQLSSLNGDEPQTVSSIAQMNSTAAGPAETVHP